MTIREKNKCIREYREEKRKLKDLRKELETAKRVLEAGPELDTSKANVERLEAEYDRQDRVFRGTLERERLSGCNPPVVIVCRWILGILIPILLIVAAILVLKFVREKVTIETVPGTVATAKATATPEPHFTAIEFPNSTTEPTTAQVQQDPVATPQTVTDYVVTNLTQTDVETIVTNALANFSTDVITQAEVQQIVDEAIAKIPRTETVTLEQIQQIVADALTKYATANAATATPTPAPVASTATLAANKFRIAKYAEEVELVVVDSKVRNASQLNLKAPLYWDRIRVTREGYGPADNRYPAWAMLHNLSQLNVSVDVPHPILFNFVANADNAAFEFVTTRDPFTQGDGWKTYTSWVGEDNIATDPYRRMLTDEVMSLDNAYVGLFLDGEVGTTAVVRVYDNAGALKSTTEVALSPLVYEGGGTTYVKAVSADYLYGEEIGHPIWLADEPVAALAGNGSHLNQVIVINPDFTGIIIIQVEGLAKGQTCHFWYGDVVVKN